MMITLTEVARILGVHYMTAYRYVRVGKLDARFRNGRWWVDRADVDRLASRSAKAREGRDLAQTRPGRRRRPWTYRQRLERRLVAGDEPGAWAVVEAGLAGGMTPQQALLDVVGPALRSIGAGWESGRLSVMDEHRASAVAARIVGRLGPGFARPGRPRGRVVLAGVQGDPHNLPGALVRDILRGEGFMVVDLGANTPIAAVVDAVAAGGRDGRLLAVGLSVSADGHARAARRTTHAVRKAAPDTLVFVGGPAITCRAAALELGADDWAADAADFARLLTRIQSAGRRSETASKSPTAAD